MQYIRLQHELTHASWDDTAGKWRLRIRHPKFPRGTDDAHDGVPGLLEASSISDAHTPVDDLFEEFEDTADILFLGTGTLSRLLWPDIDGLKDFDGRLVHSAHWDISDGAWEEGVKDWGDKSVGVIGLVCPCHPLCRVNLVPDFRRVHLPSKLSRRCSQRWRK